MYVEKLNCNPLEFQNYQACPTILKREFWESVSGDTKTQYQRLAEKSLCNQTTYIGMELWLEFYRTGNRASFEQVYFEKRKKLSYLVMAECLEKEGRFLDAIIDRIYGITSEFAWWLPAHNTYERDKEQKLYPDTTRPILELFSSETGALLAMIYQLLNPVLDEVILRHIIQNIERRIVTPFLEEQFWWMGYSDQPLCNWTPWCVKNVLFAVFTIPFSNRIRREVVLKSSFALDCFLNEYGLDGACNEGVQYYSHAALALYSATEILSFVAPGVFEEIFEEEKIKNMATFIYQMHVEDKYYLNYADSAAVAGRRTAKDFSFAKRVGHVEMQAFCANDIMAGRAEAHLAKDVGLISLWNMCIELKYAREIEAFHQEHTSFQKQNIYYESAGIFVARDDKNVLSVKAGNNGDSHNHNDVGSFILYRKGTPIFLDIGVETYTKKTFSDARYEIWTMQSAWHNLPTFDGVMQQAGKSYGASDVRVQFDETMSRIEMELQGAYPRIETMSYYRRSVSFLPNCGITIQDKTDYKNTVMLSLISASKPASLEAGLRINEDVRVEWKDMKDIEIEEVIITDQRLLLSIPSKIYRIKLYFEREMCLTITYD